MVESGCCGRAERLPSSTQQPCARTQNHWASDRNTLTYLYHVRYNTNISICRVYKTYIGVSDVEINTICIIMLVLVCGFGEQVAGALFCNISTEGVYNYDIQNN